LAEYILQRNHISFAFFEAADLRTDLPELRVVSGDGEVAYYVQDVAAADGVSRHHRNDGLGAAPDLDVQIRDVEAPDRLSSRGATGRVRVFEVPGIPAHLLVPPRTEGLRSLPGQDDDPGLVVFTGVFDSPLHLDYRQRTEGVPDFGAVYGDLRDPLRLLVPDVLEFSGRFPLYRRHAMDYMGLSTSNKTRTGMATVSSPRTRAHHNPLHHMRDATEERCTYPPELFLDKIRRIYLLRGRVNGVSTDAWILTHWHYG
jgi:hypothetical protein